MAIFAGRRLRRGRPIERILRGRGEATAPVPFTERVVRPFIQRMIGYMNAVTPQGLRAWMRDRLARAGLGDMQVAEFLVLKILVGLVGAGLAVVGLFMLGRLGFNRLALMIIAAGGFYGFLAPDFILTFRARDRQRRIRNTFPDMLDLLVVAVEAGMGLDAALSRVAERMVGPLGDELRRTIQEIRLGRPRREALFDLARRTGVEEIGAFATAVVQAEQLGISMATVLRAQADRMRDRRIFRAREQAQRIPVKIILPLFFFILPTLFLLLFGPAMINTFNTLRGMGGLGGLLGLGGGR
ncbi:MAG TPA: type II secretion system F family protein [Armatimonadetes bacterium]|nr:type II secretion system F family protein [Armatimonadota bacterium]